MSKPAVSYLVKKGLERLEVMLIIAKEQDLDWETFFNTMEWESE